jgi:hypothetical protein
MLKAIGKVPVASEKFKTRSVMGCSKHVVSWESYYWSHISMLPLFEQLHLLMMMSTCSHQWI